METLKISKAGWLGIVNLVISILNLLTVLMLFAIMSSDFYKIFHLIFGEETGTFVIRGIYAFGMYFAFPVGVINIIVGIVSKKQSDKHDNKRISRIAFVSIVFGALGTLLGGGLFVFAVFFLTF